MRINPRSVYEKNPILSALSVSVGKSSKLSNGIPTNVFFNYGFERTQMSV